MLFKGETMTEKKKNEIKVDFEIGGEPGNFIMWFDVTEFNNNNTFETLFSIAGQKSFPNKIPKKGHTIEGDFKKSTVLFEIVEIKWELKNKDRFFGKVKPIDQIIKEKKNKKLK